MTAPPPVAILLATFQGARFLEAQLQSLAAQSYRNWRLVVSDDGSTDETLAILRRFARQVPAHEVTILAGPGLGATQNFLHLVGSVRPGEALAFCDQDDVWLPDRLALGIAAISATGDAGEVEIGRPAQADRARTADAVPADAAQSAAAVPAAPAQAAAPHVAPAHAAPAHAAPAPMAPAEEAPVATAPATLAENRHAPNRIDSRPSASVHATPDTPRNRASPQRPTLHVTRTILCDPDLRPLRPAPLYTRPAGFRNALVQACTPGNTMLVDPVGAALLKAAAPGAARAGVVSHDWWSYLMISGAGGCVLRDPRQTVLYRQHGGNVMGRNDTPRAMLARLARLGAGDYGGWLRANLAALKAAAPLLTPENRAMMRDFAAALDLSGAAAAAALIRLGVYRQTRSGTAALLAAAIAGRLGRVQ